MRKGKTPTAHQNHTVDRPCGCSTEKETDRFICSCGAAYNDEVFKFIVWRCYDCGREMLVRLIC